MSLPAIPFPKQLFPKAVPLLTAADFVLPKPLDPNKTTAPRKKVTKKRATKKKTAKRIVPRAPVDVRTFTMGGWITALSNVPRRGEKTTIAIRRALGNAVEAECVARGLNESDHPRCPGRVGFGRFEYGANTQEQLAEAFNAAVGSLVGQFDFEVEPADHFQGIFGGTT